jgi:hypothetical protein
MFLDLLNLKHGKELVYNFVLRNNRNLFMEMKIFTELWNIYSVDCETFVKWQRKWLNQVFCNSNYSPCNFYKNSKRLTIRMILIWFLQLTF